MRDFKNVHETTFTVAQFGASNCLKYTFLGFPGGTVVKNPPVNSGGTRNVGSIPRSPISRSPLDKTLKPGHLSELQPVNAVNTKGQFFRASFGKNSRFQIQLDKRPLSPGTSRKAGGVPCLNPRRGLTLLSPVCRDPAIGV